MHKSGCNSDIALIKDGSDALSGVNTGMSESYAILWTGDSLAVIFFVITFGGRVTTAET